MARPPKPPNDRRFAARVLVRVGTVARQVAELHERYGWGLARIAAALQCTPVAVLRRAEATKRGVPRSVRSVHCRRCRWRGKRPRSTCTLRPCHRCGGGVRAGRPKRGAPTAAARRGAEVVKVEAYVEPSTYATLRGIAGRLCRDAAGLVLDRWARGEAVPAGWCPPVRASVVGRVEAGCAAKPRERLRPDREVNA